MLWCVFWICIFFGHLELTQNCSLFPGFFFYHNIEHLWSIDSSSAYKVYSQESFNIKKKFILKFYSWNQYLRLFYAKDSHMLNLVLLADLIPS